MKINYESHMRNEIADLMSNIYAFIPIMVLYLRYYEGNNTSIFRDGSMGGGGYGLINGF